MIAFLTLHHMDRLVLYDSSQMGTPLVVSGGKNALPKVLGMATGTHIFGDRDVGVDCAILMNPQTWVASGHLGGFSDPLMDCKECHERFRADKLIEDFAQENNIELDGSVDGWSNEKMVDFIESHNIPCPSCGKHNFTDIRQFNLMFKTFQGVTEDAKNTVYLRPETAQGIFVNFKNVQRTSRKKIPFGIGQIGKSFRNEITPGNFTFRTREFEQMELEFFCEPGTDLEWFQYWRAFCRDWLLSLGIKEDEMRLRDHSAEELCFYSKGTTDIEFLFPFGWGELLGIAIYILPCVSRNRLSSRYSG